MGGTHERERLRQAIEATRLGFGLSAREVLDVTRAAVDLRVAGVCFPLLFLSEAKSVLEETGGEAIDLVTVANFPTGNDPTGRVHFDIAEAVRLGADHIDLVAPGRLVRDGEWTALKEFVRTARLAAEDAASRAVSVKVILETAALSRAEIEGAAGAAIEAGARWLKTSTGFHPAGGATVEAVRLLRSLAPPEVGVKASGGIRTRAHAFAMLEAGADRIGTSAERAILE